MTRWDYCAPILVLQQRAETGKVGRGDVEHPAGLEQTQGFRECLARMWQVLSHLSDSDLMAGTRVRMIVTSDRPTLVGYDQDAFTARFGGLDPDVTTTLQRWRALRLANLRIFESLTPAEWERVGVHSERGDESARLTVELMAGHDRVHLAQFRRAAGA